MNGPDNIPTVTLHASAIAIEGRGLLIRGVSGSGKSSLALGLMARGADLVADDRVTLTRRDQTIRATAPGTLRGMVEARGIGLLQATPVEAAGLIAIVDLDHTETARLPEPRFDHILGIALPVLHKSEMTDFPSALIQYLRGGRKDPT